MKRSFYFIAAFAATFSLSGCSLIEGIFKGGFIFGVIIAIIIGLIIWALSSFSSQNLREDLN